MRTLTTIELEELVGWFLYHMTQEQRGWLMGEKPLTYKLLFPGVDNAVIATAVCRRINETADASPIDHDGGKWRSHS